ncbi:velvet factor-domain-containing protein [Mycena maculata]|uniref:Velvet factor-domain-containing protein n=1 Tax=Mycena maculata TaxID=230809 RepID=A0AAD7KDP6_9AGAR|nr:velvet factor-domain-containing protein [Mycena maculata]
MDPMPVLELCLFERTITPTRVPMTWDLVPMYSLFAWLVPPDGDEPIKVLKDGLTDSISGTWISSPYIMKDPENDQLTAFFAFPDLGVRLTGQFRFKFELAMDCPHIVKDGNCKHPLKRFSKPFSVVPAAKYSGVQKATPLTHWLAENGVPARVREKVRGVTAKELPRRGRPEFFVSDSETSGSASPPSGATRAASLHVQTMPRPVCAPGNIHPDYLQQSRASGSSFQSEPQPELEVLANFSEGADFGLGPGQPSALDHFLADWYSSDLVLADSE